MNPSPMGGFMEGIAKGISGGTQTYARLKQASQEEEQRRDEQAAMYEFKLVTDANIPLAIRKGALESFNARNKKWGTGIEFPAISNEIWGSSDFNKYLKKVKAIQDNKDYSLQEKLRFTRGIIAEAEGVMGVSAKAFKPYVTGLKEQAFTAGTAGMIPGGSGPITKEQRGLLALSGEGRSIIQERMKPAPTVKTPSISLYETMEVGNGRTQKMKWNPKTNKHDIPYGKPIQGVKSSYHRIGSTIYEFKNGTSKEMQKGDLKSQAVIHAMREKEWQYLDETEQYELIEKHMRLLQGTVNPSPAPPGKDLSLSTSGRKGLLGDVLDRLFPKHAESLGFGAMGKEKDALLAGQKKLTFHKVKRNTPLTKEMALKILRAAKGDRALARKMAKEQGYSF